MDRAQPNNPLHGVTLEEIVTRLVEHYGWDELADRVPIHCFQNEPSVRSSLKFLRRMPWARSKVEALYIGTRFAPPGVVRAAKPSEP
ncbi:MAG: hypothetical protein RLZZ450_19 [Pseudomonadota bacterium]|jgi:uncharacterized protein (DUF2132 family)